MQTLKKDTCSGLSGKTKLTYEVGLELDKTIWLRLVKSSGGGLLCDAWVSVDAAIETLKQAASPFSSYALHTHFKGRSANTPGFLMAVLRHEELVVPAPNKQQAFVFDNIEVARKEFKSRMSTGTRKTLTVKKKSAPAKPRKK